MSSITIGVLALQGAFAEHIDLLNKKFPNVTAREIKQTKDMAGVDGLILPGGESTVQGKWLAASDLGERLRAFTQDEGRPVFGTCAGFILLADGIRAASGKEGGQYRLGGMQVEIERNYFGRQVDSFEARMESRVLGQEPFHAVFIRAPAVHEDGVHGRDCEVLATVEHAGRRMIVALRQRNFLGTSFHPELTTDNRWHEYFVDMVRAHKDSTDKNSTDKNSTDKNSTDKNSTDKNSTDMAQDERTTATTTTTTATALIDTDLPDLNFLARGKVRDIYTIDDDKLLFVTTDRISAYDVIMKNGIPDKGKILTALSEFWFARLAHLCPHHLLTTKIEEMPAIVHPYAAQLSRRAMLVKRLEILPIEAIVRGYLTGSAWSEYRTSGTVHGLPVPPGMQESDKFAEPLFTPSTKAEQGDHDENIHPSRVAELIGPVLAARMATLSVALYVAARDYAATKGIIIADTKFEFGVTHDGTLVLVDEVLTPDSSRFWPADTYRPGRPQASFDKQYLRDHLTANHLDKQQGVEVPPQVVAGTMHKYVQVHDLLTGKSWTSQ